MTDIIKGTVVATGEPRNYTKAEWEAIRTPSRKLDTGKYPSRMPDRTTYAMYSHLDWSLK